MTSRGHRKSKHRPRKRGGKRKAREACTRYIKPGVTCLGVIAHHEHCEECTAYRARRARLRAWRCGKQHG